MALFRFISRNITYSSHHASEEKKLQEIVDQMKDSLEEDLRKRKEHSLQHEDFENKYLRFKETAKLKADLYKQTSIGYRQICCVPSFALGLVMASRVQNHFTHAPWFRLGILKDMVDVYGTVSGPVKTHHLQHCLMWMDTVYFRVHCPKRRIP